MLTLNILRENREFVLERLAVKNFKQPELVDSIIELDNQRRQIQQKNDALLAEMNNISKSIGILMKDGKKDEADQAKQRTVILKDEIQQLSEQLANAEKELNSILIQLPNLPSNLVPKGKTPEDNLEVKSGGVIPNLTPNAVPHWDLAKKYDIIDFELGVKLTGAGFPVYKGKGSKIQRALINFFLDEAHKAGYTEFMPPLMVNEDSGFGTGQLPDKEGQMYHATLDNFYLVPTAEVPVTNIFRDVIVDASQFPIKCTAYTPCFRREAGSYGKDVRGPRQIVRNTRRDGCTCRNAR
jgi:seryl-tRNA synthetase